MPRLLLLILLALACAIPLLAQPAEEDKPSIEDLQTQLQAMSDSLLQYREREVTSEFGFQATDRLKDVAAKLQITGTEDWKRFLGIEPANPVLDGMSLQKLGITPYRAVLAQQHSIYGFTELSTLAELAQQLQLPIKKLRQFAGVSGTDKSSDNYSLQTLDKVPAQVLEFENAFNQDKLKYGFSVTVVGVLIVFFALAITALVIAQLQRLNRKPKPATITLNANGKVASAPADLNSDLIAAAIAALHLYKHDIEERRRLMLTFRRHLSDQWRGSAIHAMPNRDILRKRS